MAADQQSIERTDLTSRIAGIRAIAEQLRALPAKRCILATDSYSWPLSDAATIAGGMLLDAKRLGAFDSPNDTGLRNLIELAVAGELAYQQAQKLRNDPHVTIPPRPWHVFVAAARWILQHTHGRQYKTEGFSAREVVEGCDLIGSYLHGIAAGLSESARHHGVAINAPAAVSQPAHAKKAQSRKKTKTRDRKQTRHGLNGPTQHQLEAKKLKDMGYTLELIGKELGISSPGAVSELLSRHDAAMDRIGRSTGRSLRATHSLDAGDVQN